MWNELLMPLLVLLPLLVEQFPTSKAVVFKCPRLIEYSAEQQKRAAQEIKNTPGNIYANGMVVDYGKMRKACRAMQKG